jgi:hypothetical protein
LNRVPLESAHIYPGAWSWDVTIAKKIAPIARLPSLPAPEEERWGVQTSGTQCTGALEGRFFRAIAA